MSNYTVDDRSDSEKFEVPERGKYKYNDVPLNDPRVFALIGSGKTQGCFQIESKLGKDWASAIKPGNVPEISDLIALIRPGCLESGMTETYKKVKRGDEEVHYYHHALEPIFKDTRGVMIYQEQIIRIVKELAAFNDAQASEARSAVGKKNVEKMMEVKELFFDMAKKHGILEQKHAEEIFSWIQKSARYLFVKSHAVSYGMTTYNTAYAKTHFPTEFFTAYLTFSHLKPDPVEEIRNLVNDARSLGIQVTTPNIMYLNKNFKIIGERKIAFGLNSIRDIGTTTLNDIINLGDKIKTVQGFITNVPNIGRKPAEALIKSGSCDCFGIDRIKLLKVINVIYGHSSKDADKQLELRSISNKEMEYVLKEISGPQFDTKNIIGSMVRILKSTIETKNCMKNRIPILEKKIEQCQKCGNETNKTNAIWENIYLSINLSCHAIDDLKEREPSMTCRQVYNYIPDNYKNDKFVLYCTIDKIYPKKAGPNSKNPGEEFAFLDISDSTMAIQGISMWGKTYKEYKDQLFEGAMCKVTGKWSFFKEKRGQTIESMELVEQR